MLSLRAISVRRLVGMAVLRLPVRMLAISSVRVSFSVELAGEII